MEGTNYVLARKTGNAKSDCFTRPQHPCSLAACKRKGLGSSLSKLGRQQQGGKQNTLLSKTLSPSKIVSPMNTWVLWSDKCDGCVFWLFKRDFLSFWLLSSPYELRQSYRDVVRTIVTSMILLPYLYIWLECTLFSKVVYWLGLFSIFKVVVFLLNLRPMNLLLSSPVHQVIIIALLLHRVEVALKFWWQIITGLFWRKGGLIYLGN